MSSVLHLMSPSREIIDRTLGSPEGEAAYAVAETLIDAGEECFFVGGAVRDMQLGIVPKEIDLATSALPQETAKIFRKFDDSAAHLGTVVVSVKGQTFEVTTFRKDIGIKDGRWPEAVQFGTKEEDASRRDATINAMYWNPISRELLDPFDGAKDCREKLVRFIGDPKKRIAEDALRILRLIRLRATIDGQYEPKTYQALRTTSSATNTLSGTRILEELQKLLLCPHPEIGLEDLFETGVLDAVLPELSACKGVAQPEQFHAEGDVWNHLLACTRQFRDDDGADVRIAALLHDIGKVQTFAVKERIRFDHHAEASADLASVLLKRLQAPSALIKKIDWLIRHHMMMASFEKLSDERKAHWYFHPWFKELLQLFWLDAAGTNPGDYTLYDWIINDYDQFLNSHPRPEKPLLSGEDIMNELGIGAGEEVGRILKLLHDAQVRKKITTKREARAFLQEQKKS